VLTSIEAVVSPVFHTYVLAPVAVKVIVLPGQGDGQVLLGKMETFGDGLTVTFTSHVSAAPLASVVVTE
jgi:hypothetical protein